MPGICMIYLLIRLKEVMRGGREGIYIHKIMTDSCNTAETNTNL